MNKEYIYLDGKVIVEDEKGNKKVVEYQDNIKEILVQENLIETMEKKQKELTKKLNANKENNKPYIPYIVPAALFAFLIAKPIMGTLFGVDTAMTVDTIFGTMNFMTPILGVTGVIVFSFATALEILSYSQYRLDKKSRRAAAAEYEYLQKELKTQKEILEKMRKDKAKTLDDGKFKIEKVNHLEKLKTLKGWLILYSNLGFSAEKYYKLYQNNQLEETLAKDGYSKLACDRAREFIEEKGPILTKRRIIQKDKGDFDGNN